MALGPNAKTEGSNQIVLGDSNSTVVIPGKVKFNGDVTISGALHVHGDANLAKDNGRAVYIGVAQQNWNKWRFERIRCEDTGSFQHRALYVWKASDRRLKNVGDVFHDSLKKIEQLKIYNYTYKNDPEKTPHVGVIAQDLQKVFPNAVMKGEDGFLRIRWDEMFYAMINAIKELDVRTSNDAAALRKENSELKKQVSAMQYQIKNLEKRLDKLESRK